MNVTFALDRQNLERFQFADSDSNPGVGGTQFTTIQLAIRLARSLPDWRITLANTGPITIDDCPSNLAMQVINTVSDHLDSDVAYEQDVVVVPVRTLQRIEIDVLRRSSRKIIAWSRHPGDSGLRALDTWARLGAAVSVGNYQWYTNSWLRAPHFYIQNVFCPPDLPPEPGPAPPSYDHIRLVHLGALVRGKGFHLIAEMWPEIREAFESVSLEVIGSSDVYRPSDQHALVPTGPAFADAILAHVSEDDIRSGAVVFHGNLGSSKFEVIRRAHIALLNPTGRSEAFPASPLECMWAGRPVIASANHGMWDSMRHFPELTLTSTRDVVDRIRWFIAREDRYTDVVNRGLQVAGAFRDETPDILRKWEALLLAVADGRSSDLHLPAPRPRPPHHRRISLRALRRRLRSAAVRGPAGVLVRAARNFQRT